MTTQGSAGFWVYTYFSDQSNNVIGGIVFFLLLWIEIAQIVRIAAGVKMNPAWVSTTNCC